MNYVRSKSAGERFKDFASAFHEKIFVSVVVYADETGTHDPTGKLPGSEMCGAAGYVGWADDWAKLCGQWQAVLNQFAVSSFHFKQYANKKDRTTNPKSPYYQWSAEKLDAFLFELAPIAQRWTMFGVISLVSTRDYNRIFPIADRVFWKHPYLVSLLPFYGGVLEEIRRRFKLPGEKIVFVFDRANQLMADSTLIFEIVKRSGDPDHRMDTIAFSSTSEHPGLQAADLLAYAARQKSQAMVSKKDKSVRKLDRYLGLGSHIKYHIDTADSLRKKYAGLKALGLDAKGLQEKFGTQSTMEDIE
jgi:hypothetical protein